MTSVMERQRKITVEPRNVRQLVFNLEDVTTLADLHELVIYLHDLGAPIDARIYDGCPDCCGCCGCECDGKLYHVEWKAE